MSASNLDGASATSARCPSRSGGILHPCGFGQDLAMLVQRDVIRADRTRAENYVSAK